MDGILDEATLEAVELHLEACQACRNELALLRAVSIAASEIEEVNPPASLRDSIREAVAAEKAASNQPCEEYLVALSSHVDGELSLTETAELMAHVKSCPACEKELQMLRNLSGAMTLVNEVDPPTDLRERIAAATTQAPRLKNLVARMLESLIPSKIGCAVAGTAAAVFVAYMAIGPSTPPEPIVAKVQTNQPHSDQVTTPEQAKIAEAVELEQTTVATPKAPSARQIASKPTHVVKAKEPKPIVNVAALREPYEPKKAEQHTHVPTIEERTVAVKPDEQPRLTADSRETIPAEVVVAEAPEATPSQPLKLRPQEASINHSERQERFMKNVQIEVERRQKPDDYAKLDIIKITK